MMYMKEGNPYMAASLILHLVVLVLLLILLPHYRLLQKLNIELVPTVPPPSGRSTSPQKLVQSHAIPLPGLGTALAELETTQEPKMSLRTIQTEPLGDAVFSSAAQSFSFSIDELLMEASPGQTVPGARATAIWEQGGDHVGDSLDASDLARLELARPWELTIAFTITREGIVQRVEGHKTGNAEVDAALSRFLSKLTFRPAEQEYTALLILRLQPGAAF